jgi:phosphatidylserine/phosphatidylglycerophosphate/cardiolipin synthase-like enzyme
MATTSKSKNGFTVIAYQGDAKTLLAFNLATRKSATNLAGFTIQCQPKGQAPFFLCNTLQFAKPGQHTQVATEPPNSSVNAPFHKFRWVHVPGSFHQGTNPAFGPYTYTATPRFFDDKQSMLPIDLSRSVSVTIDVQPFTKKGLELGFARGFTQSQAFVHHFGLKALIRPATNELLFDTSQVSGTNPKGETYTFAEEYDWLGFTARERIFDTLNEVLGNKNLSVDVFAYDLNEPDIMGILLTLAGQGRIRMILDNASLHHSASAPKPEDQFEALFTKAAVKDALIVRGKFARFAHDKVFIVSNKSGPVKVLTGSTNFSVTGVYVNSNHVLVFNDKKVAAQYADVFEESLTALGGKKPADVFGQSAVATETFAVSSVDTPKSEITFSPHQAPFATAILDGIAARVEAEGKKAGGSVLFAVMALNVGTGPVIPALNQIHANQEIFSYGISDTPAGIALYTPGKKTGVLVTGKPAKSQLPPPFDQVPSVGGHQVHHKFIVCGFNTADAVVYCGSSNLAEGGEEQNGDNLIAIHDRDVATVFAIEAIGLVDHFDFLDRVVGKQKPTSPSQQQEAVSAGFFLSTTDKWVDKFFDPNDLRSVDRKLFG